ncbi:NACHT, LRR and PYD domains-containing protein 6-like [Clupea harengus]|uniref:NACHT, LRR and PYD domains-containing protein 6-like n=1 Tax=Clupea harengus TaxID=7950 RepID=A0A8M1KBJ4_CLUHA|nr:NACHT, LRR and PYD domains-containing protein 6-like [Clupea harengus]
MTAALREELRNTLGNLTGADFKRFKHLLRDQGQIPWGKLEKADINDTVDLMVEMYCMKAGDVMLTILKKMNHNQLAMENDLEESLREVKRVLRNTLGNLTDADFKTSKHRLRDQDDKIPWGQLEKADRDDTVDLLVQVYSTEAGDNMLTILKEINQNQSAIDLEKDLEECECVAHSL